MHLYSVPSLHLLDSIHLHLSARLLGLGTNNDNNNNDDDDDDNNNNDNINLSPANSIHINSINLGSTNILTTYEPYHYPLVKQLADNNENRQCL